MNTNMRVPYRPDSQESARYSVAPFRRIEISLNKDRTQGELLPQIEGDFIYVERSDFPCLLSFVTGDGTIKNSIVAMEGREISTPFKGIILSHPVVTNDAIQQQDFSLSLIIGHGGSTTNTLQDLVSRFPPPSRSLIAAATQFQQAFYLPDGARKIKSFSLYGTLTTAAGAPVIQSLILSFTSLDGATNVLGPAPMSKTFRGGQRTYGVFQNGSEAIPFSLTPITATTSWLAARVSDIVVPSGAFEVKLDLITTNTSVVPAVFPALYYA